MKANKTATIKIATAKDRAKTDTRQKAEAIARAKKNKASKETKSDMIYLKDKKGNTKYGERLTGKTAVPDLNALRKKKIITSLD